MKPFLVAAVLAFVGTIAPLHAQQGQQRPGANPSPQSDGGGRKLPFPLWKAELPGGSYLVARNAISAVSTQQYILDGVARVTEVNVTTNGNFHPRFYYLEMLQPAGVDQVPGAQLAIDRAQPVLEGAAKQAAPEVWSKVVKNYPATTHAGTIEFRLDTADQLQKLYESVERVWLTGESEVFTPDGVHKLNADDEIKNANDDTGSGGPGAN